MFLSWMVDGSSRIAYSCAGPFALLRPSTVLSWCVLCAAFLPAPLVVDGIAYSGSGPEALAVAFPAVMYPLFPLWFPCRGVRSCTTAYSGAGACPSIDTLEELPLMSSLLLRVLLSPGGGGGIQRFWEELREGDFQPVVFAVIGPEWAGMTS